MFHALYLKRRMWGSGIDMILKTILRFPFFACQERSDGSFILIGCEPWCIPSTGKKGYTRCIAVSGCGSREIFLDGVRLCLRMFREYWFLEPFRGARCAVQPVAAPFLSGVVEG